MLRDKEVDIYIDVEAFDGRVTAFSLLGPFNQVILFHGVNSFIGLEVVKMISFYVGNKELLHWGGIEE